MSRGPRRFIRPAYSTSSVVDTESQVRLGRERWTSDDDLAFAGELLTRACSDDPAGAEELLEVAIEHATYTQYLRLLDELLGRERR